MPFGQYRGIADADIDAVVAYLRTVPAVEETPWRTDLPHCAAAGLGPADHQADHGTPGERQGWPTGAYLAGPLGHCVECHADGPR